MTETDRLKAFVHRLAAMNLKAPPGARQDSHAAKLAREAKRDARRLLDTLSSASTPVEDAPQRIIGDMLAGKAGARDRARAALSNQDIGPPVYLGGAGLTAVEVKDIDTAGLAKGRGKGG